MDLYYRRNEGGEVAPSTSERCDQGVRQEDDLQQERYQELSPEELNKILRSKFGYVMKNPRGVYDSEMKELVDNSSDITVRMGAISGENRYMGTSYADNCMLYANYDRYQRRVAVDPSCLDPEYLVIDGYTLFPYNFIDYSTNRKTGEVPPVYRLYNHLYGNDEAKKQWARVGEIIHDMRNMESSMGDGRIDRVTAKVSLVVMRGMLLDVLGPATKPFREEDYGTTNVDIRSFYEEVTDPAFVECKKLIHMEAERREVKRRDPTLASIPGIGAILGRWDKKQREAKRQEEELAAKQLLEVINEAMSKYQ